MSTDRSTASRRTDSATVTTPLNTVRSLLTELNRLQGRAPRVLELSSAESRPYAAELAREVPLELVPDDSPAAPDLVIIHPQTGLVALVRSLYAVRDKLSTATLLCGPGIDQPGRWPGLQIVVQQFIQDYRNDAGLWMALPSGITHLQGLPAFENIAPLVQQVEADLRAEQTTPVHDTPEQPLATELIATAIRVLLDREPAGTTEIAEKAKHCKDTRSLRNNIISSAEFKRQNPALLWLHFSAEEPPMRIQLATTDSERQDLLQHIQASWEHLGATEPHWSVLTAEQYKQKNIAVNEDAFYETGRPNVESLWRSLQRNGVDPAALKTCLEYGCGLGRVTRWLAERFDKVYGYDISRAHLEGAGDYLSRKGLRNVTLRHIGSPADVAQLEAVDLVYSVIVLQHNPPPVIAMIVRGLLTALRPGGVAYFQVPTYQRGYSFSTANYLADHRGLQGMEMHVLPQAEVFDIAAQSGAQVLEVFEDSWTGIIDGGRSNTFIVRKNR